MDDEIEDDLDTSPILTTKQVYQQRYYTKNKNNIDRRVARNNYINRMGLNKEAATTLANQTRNTDHCEVFGVKFQKRGLLSKALDHDDTHKPYIVLRGVMIKGLNLLEGSASHIGKKLGIKTSEVLEIAARYYREIGY